MPEKKPSFKRLRTISIFIAFLGLGLHGCIIGPVLLDLEILLNTDTATMGILFIVTKVSFVVGSILCGQVIGRFNQELLLAVVIIISAASIVGSPWIPNALVFMFVFGIAKGGSSGYINTAGQPYILGLWAGSRFQDPLLQLLHLVWAVAATVSPLLMQPFLSNRIRADDADSEGLIHHGLIRQNVSEVISYPYTAIPNMTTELSPQTTTNVQYGFLALGGIIFMTSLFPFIVFLLAKPSLRPLPIKSCAILAKQRENKRFKWTMLICLCVYFTMHCGMESTTVGLIAVYVVKGLGWEKFKGSLISSVLLGAFTIGRLVAVPVVTFCHPRAMLTMSLVTMVISLVTMLFAPEVNESLTWVATGIYGFALGPLFATGILWAARYVVIDGPASSVFLIGSSIGGTIFPALTAFVFEKLGCQWMIYILLALNGSAITAFVVIQCIACRHGEMTVLIKGHDSQEKMDVLVPLENKK